MAAYLGLCLLNYYWLAKLLGMATRLGSKQPSSTKKKMPVRGASAPSRVCQALGLSVPCVDSIKAVHSGIAGTAQSLVRSLRDPKRELEFTEAKLRISATSKPS